MDEAGVWELTGMRVLLILKPLFRADPAPPTLAVISGAATRAPPAHLVWREWGAEAIAHAGGSALRAETHCCNGDTSQDPDRVSETKDCHER